MAFGSALKHRAGRGPVAAALAAILIVGLVLAVTSRRGEEPQFVEPSPALSAVATPRVTSEPSLASTFVAGDVLRVTGDGLGGLIEAYRDNLLYVVGVVERDGDLRYLVEGPARSAQEEASMVEVAASTIEANAVQAGLVCPDPPASLSQFDGVPPFARPVCFTGRLTLEDVWVDLPIDGDVALATRPDGLLSGHAEAGSGSLPFSFGGGVSISSPGWLTVTGQFGRDDGSCGDEFGRLRCRERFVIEEVRTGTSPFAVMRGTWRWMSAAPIAGRTSYVALATDRGTLVWGGDIGREATMGAIYDVAKDKWKKIARAPGVDRLGVAAASSGREVFFWGGFRGWRELADGLRYDTRRDRWSRIPAAPIDASGGVGAWTGETFVVVSSKAQSAAWDPSVREWRRLPDPPLPVGHLESVWTGRELIVLGIAEGGVETVVGAALDPKSWTWRRIADVPYDGLTLGIRPVWTDKAMLFAGHSYDPVADRWRVLRRDGCVQRAVSDGVWTGRFVISQIQAYDPARGRCLSLPDAPSRPGFDGIRTHEFHTPFWVDGRLVVWSGGTGLDGPAPPPDGIVFIPDEP